MNIKLITDRWAWDIKKVSGEQKPLAREEVAMATLEAGTNPTSGH